MSTNRTYVLRCDTLGCDEHYLGYAAGQYVTLARDVRELAARQGWRHVSAEIAGYTVSLDFCPSTTQRQVDETIAQAVKR